MKGGAAVFCVACVVAGAAFAVRSAGDAPMDVEAVAVEVTTLFAPAMESPAPQDTAPKVHQQALLPPFIVKYPIAGKPGAAPDNVIVTEATDLPRPTAPDTTTSSIPTAVKETRLASAAPDQIVVPQTVERTLPLPAPDIVVSRDEPREAPDAEAQDAVEDESKSEAKDGGIDTGANDKVDGANEKVATIDLSFIELPDNCASDPGCIDRYLWTLYERAPKIDAQRKKEQRKVKVRNKKGKLVTRTRTFTRIVHEEFAWKDPKAAERIGMPMMDYVIGGMDKKFKLKLFHLLREAEVAGMTPGITSAFRDDYRQSIATGTRAASNKSFHGGSSRGGYGHGLAVDVVSLEGETRGKRWLSTVRLWNWIDENGADFGLGRPYRDRDPPHVTPIDGQEYAMTTRHRPVKPVTKLLARGSKLPVKNDAVQQAKAAETQVASAQPELPKPSTAQTQVASADAELPNSPPLKNVPQPRPKPTELVEAQQKAVASSKHAAAQPKPALAAKQTAQAKAAQPKQGTAKQAATKQASAR